MTLIGTRLGRLLSAEWHMGPGMAVHDASDRRLVNADGRCDLRVGRASIRSKTDQHNQPLVELGVAVSCPYWSVVPVLVNLVGHVFDGSSEKEMGRPHAGRVVAAVENVFVVRDRSVIENPRGTMRSDSATAQDGVPVPTRVHCAGPHPTDAERRHHKWTVLVDLQPEAIGR